MRFRIGEPLYLTGDILKEAEREQAVRLIVDPWENIIQEYLQRSIPADWFDRGVDAQKNYWIFNSEEDIRLIERDRICASEILTVCLGIEPKRQTSLDRKRVLDIIRKMSEYKYYPCIRFGLNYGRTSGFIKEKRCQRKMSERIKKLSDTSDKKIEKVRKVRKVSEQF